MLSVEALLVLHLHIWNVLCATHKVCTLFHLYNETWMCEIHPLFSFLVLSYPIRAERHVFSSYFAVAWSWFGWIMWRACECSLVLLLLCACWPTYRFCLLLFICTVCVCVCCVSFRALCNCNTVQQELDGLNAEYMGGYFRNEKPSTLSSPPLSFYKQSFVLLKSLSISSALKASLRLLSLLFRTVPLSSYTLLMVQWCHHKTNMSDSPLVFFLIPAILHNSD